MQNANVTMQNEYIVIFNENEQKYFNKKDNNYQSHLELRKKT